MNKLYFSDCIDVLKLLHKQNSNGFIDLIYIDPPFNAKRKFSVIFENAETPDAIAQKMSFDDTWTNVSYKEILKEIQTLNLNLFNFIHSVEKAGIPVGSVSYITMMTIRIFYMHKVLKDTGCLYLHCDPTMSHYLKIVCDLVFGESNFRNEITWKRSHQHNLATRKFDTVTDIIFFYSKSDKYTFKQQYQGLSEEELNTKFPYIEEETGRRFTHQKLEQAANSYSKDQLRIIQGKEVKTNLGWRWTQKTFDERIKENPLLIYWTSNGKPRYKTYADEYKGRMITNLWDDIPGLSANNKEKLGYDTQKPKILLERILNASSNKGDLVADFFCGCGTTVAVAQGLKRKWIGVDISHLAIGLIEKRLRDTYGNKIKGTYEIDGFPKDIATAKQLAAGTDKGRLKFQDWIIEAMLGGIHNPKKTADGGWDGHLTFDIGNKREIVLIEVKSGNVNVKNLREFIHVIAKEKAAIGLFICFEEQVTKPMRLEAKDAGYYHYKHQSWQSNFDKIQIVTIEQLLEGEFPKLPLSMKQTFKTAQRKLNKDGEQEKFELE